MQVRRVWRENTGSKALWLCAMQISVNMAFHLLLMHCYTATPWKETVWQLWKLMTHLLFFFLVVSENKGAREDGEVFPPLGGVMLGTDSVFRPVLPATVSCSAALLSSLGWDVPEPMGLLLEGVFVWAQEPGAFGARGAISQSSAAKISGFVAANNLRSC